VAEFGSEKLPVNETGEDLCDNNCGSSLFSVECKTHLRKDCSFPGKIEENWATLIPDGAPVFFLRRGRNALILA
jgi:hypothetical protein